MNIDFELSAIQLILFIGWPLLFVMTFLIIRRARSFYIKLRGTMIGKLIIPTVFGWLYGMFMLGIVATSYMLHFNWYYTVIPAFATFLAAIIIIYRAIGKWETEASDLQAFYSNLEYLVKKRTKELEDAHKLQIDHEKEIQKLKDQFVFVAAHELKTPVTAIKWAIEGAMEDNKLSDDVKDQLDVVHQSNLRLIKLVDDLLNTARIEAGTIKIEPQMISLNETINSILKELTPLFNKNNINLKSELAEDRNVFVDKERLKQVLVNILSNAVKYNRENGDIKISTSYDDNFAKIAVKDSGYGISEEDQKKLFGKFCRIKDKNTEKVEGTGLGLYLTKEIIKKSGGDIFVESEVDKGSTFIFTVPLKKLSDNSEDT